jgi:hypothetical protein
MATIQTEALVSLFAATLNRIAGSHYPIDRSTVRGRTGKQLKQSVPAATTGPRIEMQKNELFTGESPDMPSFRTSGGTCHIEGHQLRFERSLFGQLHPDAGENTAFAVVYVVALLAASVGPLYAIATWSVPWPLTAVGIVVALFAISRASNHVTNLFKSTTISTENVSRVETLAGKPWIARPRIVVIHHKRGVTKKRLVTLPSRRFADGDEVLETAKDQFRRAGMRVEESGDDGLL